MDPAALFTAFFWAHWPVLLRASNAAWSLSELWIFARDIGASRGRRSDRSSLALIVLAVVVSLGLAMWCRPHLGFLNMPDGEAGAFRFAGGLVLMWVGIAFRLWAVITLGRLFRVTVEIQQDHQLVTHGPFKRLRNPSYTGALLTLTGQGLTYGNWASLAICIVGPLIALGWRIHVEEAAMRARFGEAYDAYAKRSWAIIPLVW